MTLETMIYRVGNAGMTSLFLKSITNGIHEILKPAPEFTRRILHRFQSFWGYPGGSKTDMPLFNAEDPWGIWKSQPNWQRVLGNKYNSKGFASKLGCRVPQFYWKGNDFTTIDFQTLPENYVIKPTIGKSSNQVFLMRGNLNLFDGKTYTNNEIISSHTSILNENPQMEFMIEEFLPTETGEIKIHDDYKFYMFNGEVGCIRLINRASAHGGANRYFDEDWNTIPTPKITKYLDAPYQPPPICLPEMISFAKALSREVRIFIRVDLYATKEGAVFGEFALTPSHGYGYSKAGSRFLIQKWEKNCKGMI